jgi:hypothetical protein
MKPLPRYLILFGMMLALASPLMMTGCEGRVSTGYRVYDPGYRDYHTWDDNHKEHQDFRKRSKDEQKQYWDWRHNQH